VRLAPEPVVITTGFSFPLRGYGQSNRGGTAGNLSRPCGQERFLF
jgi:hypothetical protein